MSGRTLQQFALVALLAVSMAAQAAAQTPPTVAPMPRPAQQHGEITIEFGIGGPNVLFFNYEHTIFGQTTVAPMPREKKADAIEEEFGIEGGFQPPSTNYGRPILNERNFDVTPTVPQMPIPVPPCSDAVKCPLPPAPGLAQSHADSRRLFNYYVELFGCPDDSLVPFSVALPPRNLPEASQHPMVVLSTFRCDNNGGWWVEVVRIPQPRPTHIDFPSCCSAAPVQVVEARQIAEPQPACCAKAGKLSGTWMHEMESIVVAATFIGDEMKITFSQTDGTTTVAITVTAEYAVTKEGLVHGVITGVDSEVKHNTKTERLSQLTSEFPDCALALMVQEMVDSPFSFRIKSTSAGIMVSKLKIAGVEGLDAKGFAILGGMFKPCKEGSIPAPKAPKSSQDGAVGGGTTLPSGRYLEHYPQYFSPDPACPLPRELAAQEGQRSVCPMPAPVAPAQGVPPMAVPTTYPQLPPPQQGWSPAAPANVPPTEFGMMVDVFGQMFCPGQRCPTPAVTCPTPVQPAGVYFPQAGSAPQQGGTNLIPPAGLPPVPPAVALPATQIPMAAKPALVGTWCREFGPKLCVVTIAPDHLTISVTEAKELDEGKTITAGWVITADYHLTRDGTTVVGLITGADIELQGELPEEQMDSLTDTLKDFQKALSDKPFAMTVRVYGDTLVIGNVRMPKVADKTLDPPPASLIGGRYKNLGNKPLPKPKVVKADSSAKQSLPGTPTLPGADPLPGYAPSSGLVPSGYPGAGSSSGPAPPAPLNASPAVPFSPAASAPATSPVPQMPPPVKLMEPPTPLTMDVKPLFKMFSKKRPTPDQRMEHSLYDSEDLRQINNEWRQFWLNSKPSHLTPERIRGGII